MLLLLHNQLYYLKVLHSRQSILVIQEVHHLVFLLLLLSYKSFPTHILFHQNISYHIHIVKETEDIDFICKKYNISKEELLNINGITDININDKLLVPITNE